MYRNSHTITSRSIMYVIIDLQYEEKLLIQLGTIKNQFNRIGIFIII